MHFVIDIIAALLLLFFLLSGWHKGFLLSLLGIVRVILAYGAAYFAGRYVGYWLGEVANRPRIVTIPMVAGLTFVVVTFVFHIIMWHVRENHADKTEENEDYRRPWFSSLCGGIINTSAGLFTIILIFWLTDLFMVGVTGGPIPGAERSKFAGLARRSVYEGSYIITAREGRESQAAAMARVISNPAKGMTHLEKVLAADSVQTLLKDRQFASDLLSGDPERIEQNPSLQLLFNDRPTLEELKDIGVLSGKEKKSELCRQLSRFGSNEKIQESVQNLKDKDLLATDQIMSLIRDPDFDVIVAELLK
jgi:hypothetical protein